MSDNIAFWLFVCALGAITSYVAFQVFIAFLLWLAAIFGTV